VRHLTTSVLVVWALFGLLGGGVGCSKNQPADAKPTGDRKAPEESEERAKGNIVVLYEYRFNPNTLTISKGAEVTFRNKDQEVHNVKIAALDVDHDVEPGENWSYTFESTGEYAVENAKVEKTMKMTIVVEE
jgi:plastocyanin